MGEKNSKYFLGLEKKNKRKNTIRKLILNNKEITDQKLILKELQSFYQKRYTKQVFNSDNDIQEFLSKIDLPRLSEDEVQSCDGNIQITEVLKALNSMPVNKSPGNNGLPVEFYLTFFDIIGDDITKCLNENFQCGELTNSQRKAVITLIAKPGKDADYEAAFDSLDHDFIFTTLKHFGFSDSFLSWIKLLYTNVESNILNNGIASGHVSLKRGNRQGDPISSYVFILMMQVLSSMIMQDINIHGIKVGQKEFKMVLFADDSTILIP